MKKKTIGWDKSFEKMTVSKEVLRGDVTMFLMLEGGGYHRCQFHSTYKYDFCVCISSDGCEMSFLNIWLSSLLCFPN